MQGNTGAMNQPLLRSFFKHCALCWYGYFKVTGQAELPL
jgi:hypothetical protein